LRAAALRLAAEIAENAPLAVIATRKTLRVGLADAINARTTIEHRAQTWLRATEDFKEGVRSVAERGPVCSPVARPNAKSASLRFRGLRSCDRGRWVRGFRPGGQTLGGRTPDCLRAGGGAA